MNTRTRFAVVCAVVLLATTASHSQDLPSYSLTLEGPASYSGCSAEVDISSKYTAFVTESDNPDPDNKGGAQGWSISVASVGITIDEITDEGTDAAAKFAGGFVQAGTTDRAGEGSECDGLNGAVQAYVLSFTMPITLDPNATSSIAVLICSGTAVVPDVPSEVASLFFADGCQGPGQPVGNAVTWDGATVNPEKGSLSIEVGGHGDCHGDGPLSLVFANAESPDPDASPVLDVLTNEQGFEGTSQLVASIRSDLPGTGVQGWSLSSAASGGDVAIVGVTTEGTDGAGRFAGGFDATELSTRSGEGSECDGLLGAVSAVVLSFTMPITLDPVGEESVLILELEPTIAIEVPEGENPQIISGTVSFVDGCQGAGQPVSNVATVDGETRDFVFLPSVDVSFITPPPPPLLGPYVLCDANSDALVNLADAVWVVNALVRGGDPFACLIAADCNTDDLVDLSDAITIAHGLFGLGSLPPLVCDTFDAAEFPDNLGCDSATCE